MRDVLDDIRGWYSSGEPFALATVVGAYKSAPRQPGAAMAVSGAGEAVGSVSGGCVEGAVYELGQQVLLDGEPIFETYGVSDDDAFAVGLTCGGIIDMFVERVSPGEFPEFAHLVAAIDAGEPIALATVVSGPGQIGARMLIWPDRHCGTLGSARLDDAVCADGAGQLSQGHSGILRYGADGERLGYELAVFVQSFAPAPRMLVFGAIDFAAAVARSGKFLGYHVTVCDARPVFATAKRFREADEVVVDWPHRYLAAQLEARAVDARTVICVLTHDPKFDVPVLRLALDTDAAYIGAMGSRRTHEDRLQRLREEGVTAEQLARLHSPIGLDLGARTPEETAISIAAEIIARRWGGSGKALTDTDGAIHRDTPAPPP
ncbi:MAG: XdhC family protein [Sporichthyaceae bacterium]